MIYPHTLCLPLSPCSLASILCLSLSLSEPSPGSLLHSSLKFQHPMHWYWWSALHFWLRLLLFFHHAEVPSLDTSTPCTSSSAASWTVFVSLAQMLLLVYSISRTLSSHAHSSFCLACSVKCPSKIKTPLYFVSL